MASTKLILLLAAICVLFWFWVGLKGMILRQIKLPYLLILFFCINIIIAIAKSYELNTQNNAFFYVTIFEILTLAGIYLFLKSENFWEKLDNIFDEDAILSASQKSFIGSSLIRIMISFVGKKITSRILSTLGFLVATSTFVYIAFYIHVI